ncbi:preprotein translocase subunit YajC [Acetanaerobacterium elongatum]|uniref:Preprotein translocase subunit YajC n=1 Tax=Acetanaerobacterium elongatum TaxID=258515 RepID=A0A1H0BCH6_9FIRM|nr:preprotein translocase subunit YajC [Acetanaerobacterium elongatum]SDN43382.1 preprotein translocase subunit YajC [Acetanaerobacterium elongatum]
MSEFLLSAANTASAATASGSATPANSALALLIQVGPIVLIFVVFYFFLIRPQKKKEKEIQKMRSDLQVGDEIVTSGGIIGLVVSIREDTVVIETGSDRSKIRIARWAIQTNNTVHNSEDASSK